MAKFVLQNVRLFAGGVDLTSNSNKAEISVEFEEKDATPFAATGGVWHESLAGIASSTINASGQWEAAANATGPQLPDDALYPSLGSIHGVTLCPATAADGAVAYVGGFLRQNYTAGGAVGDVAPWQANWQGNWPVARGIVLAPPSARTTTGTGTIFQITGGVPTANDFLIGTLHVLSVAGTTPSVTATVQSAALVGFGSPTTRLTFNAANAPGGQVLRVAGPITDQFFRLSYTISGSTPSLLFMSGLGVS